MTSQRSIGAFREGTWRIIVLEFWERFSYYGLLAILVLFMTSSEARGGFGWSDSRALNLLAIFTAAAFILPTLGGYLADRWLGVRRAVLHGSTLLVIGNVAIAMAALGPSFAPQWLNRGAAQDLLFAGLAAISLGNGLFKSSLVTLLGALVADDDAKRDQVFRYYYQSIMLGALAAALSVGALAQAVGWWAGFALAAIGMTISWLMFVTWRVGPEPISTMSRPQPASKPSGTAAPRLERLGSMAILCGFLVLIAVGWVQLHGLWLLEFERWGDRGIGSFTVPSAWLLAVNGIVVAVGSPIVGWLWRRLVAAGVVPPGFVPQLITAFAIMGATHLGMAYAFHDPVAGGVPLIWPVLGAFFITVAELIFWPSSYNSILKLAPANAQSTLMGVWIAMLGAGQFFSHQIARAADVIGFSNLSVAIGISMLAGGAMLWVVARLRPAMRTL